ncbi:beta-glucosidase, partial [Sarracenia purpurea var. burkii]
MEPLTRGRYPPEMVKHVGDRLPEFSPKDSKLVQSSYDFIGLNYYTASYARDVKCPSGNVSYLTDPCVDTSKKNSDGEYIGKK